MSDSSMIGENSMDMIDVFKDTLQSGMSISQCKEFRSKHRKRVPSSVKSLVGNTTKPSVFLINGYQL